MLRTVRVYQVETRASKKDCVQTYSIAREKEACVYKPGLLACSLIVSSSVQEEMTPVWTREPVRSNWGFGFHWFYLRRLSSRTKCGDFFAASVNRRRTDTVCWFCPFVFVACLQASKHLKCASSGVSDLYHG